jgi:hypothetical protein
MTTPAPWTDQQLRATLADARAQHRAGAGSVLDVLLRAADGDAARLGPALRAAGVALLDASARPDPQVLDLTRSRTAAGSPGWRWKTPGTKAGCSRWRG